jgi:hypothetical protein
MTSSTDVDALADRMSALEAERDALFNVDADEPLEDGVTLTDDIVTDLGSSGARREDDASPSGPGTQTGGYSFAPSTEASDNFDENTWSTIKSYFANPTALIAHQARYRPSRIYAHAHCSRKPKREPKPLAP